jgi:translation initiation factor 2 beta subunit (eIF-2beta)/eIF-5
MESIYIYIYIYLMKNLQEIRNITNENLRRRFFLMNCESCGSLCPLSRCMDGNT